jgi:hypothetical protein
VAQWNESKGLTGDYDIYYPATGEGDFEIPTFGAVWIFANDETYVDYNVGV